MRRLRRALVGGSDDISQALIDEREALAAQNQQMREALEEIHKWVDRYTSPGHPVSTFSSKALNLPDLSTGILRKRDALTIASFLEAEGKWMTNDAMLVKRDAETLRKAADWFESAPVEYAFRARTVLLSMIKELESGK